MKRFYQNSYRDHNELFRAADSHAYTKKTESEKQRARPPEIERGQHHGSFAAFVTRCSTVARRLDGQIRDWHKLFLHKTSM